MPFQKIVIRPGVNTQWSPTLNEGGFSTSQLIRFKDGLPQKMGGWENLNVGTMIGVGRGSHSWADLLGNPYMAIGSEQRLMAIQQGELIDITPVRATANITPDFSTTNTDTEVTVGDVGHGAEAGDWINIIVPVSVGGIVLLGYYQITSVIDPDNYTIEATTAATATVSNGGAVPEFDTTMGSATVTVTLEDHGYSVDGQFEIQVSTSVGGLTLSGTYNVDTVVDADSFEIDGGSAAGSTANAFENSGNARISYLIPTGYASATPITGYGIGEYGAGPYGMGGGGTVIAPLRQWFMDNWGENWVGNYTNGPIFEWVPLSGDPAAQISGAPTINTAMFVSMPQQIMVALGAETGGTQDPNLIRWSDVADNTVWTASSTNQAGSYRIPTGSKIIGGILIDNQALIWTDVDVWTMQYVGPPFIFGFNKVGAGSNELLAGRAVANLGSATYWASPHGFFTSMGGNIQVLPCTVWDKIFYNLNTAQVDKCHMATNDLFKEITFWYPSATGDGEVDSYAKFNVLDNVWDYGSQVVNTNISIARTTWQDVSVMGNPIGVDPSGNIFQHETGYDAAGLPMMESITSGYFDIGEGDEYVFIERMIPDFVWFGSNQQVNIYVTVTDYPGATAVTHGPFLVTPTTQYFLVRARGRQASITIAGVGTGCLWRLGACRYLAAPSGRN